MIECKRCKTDITTAHYFNNKIEFCSKNCEELYKKYWHKPIPSNEQVPYPRWFDELFGSFK